MPQSMSRVAHCIDNGPIEGFWGILKQERYYGRRFAGKRDLVQMIEKYICYYNTRRVQRNLSVLTPMEKPPISGPTKSDQQLSAAGLENFSFFHCPLDEVLFKAATGFSGNINGSGGISRNEKGYVLVVSVTLPHRTVRAGSDNPPAHPAYESNPDLPDGHSGPSGRGNMPAPHSAAPPPFRGRSAAAN